MNIFFGSELAIATVISGAEKYPVCKYVGQHVSVLGVFVCALADLMLRPCPGEAAASASNCEKR